MKSIFFVLLLLIGFNASANMITANSAVVTRSPGSPTGDEIDAGLLDNWCVGEMGRPSINSFEAFKSLKALAGGLYTCEGDYGYFVGSQQLIVYRLGNCTKVDGKELVKTCPKN